MCKSNADGGKRCEYADMVANVRRKARYKLRDAGYNNEREIEKAVKRWKEAHPELAVAHLPARQSFQRPSNGLKIPDNIQALFSPKARTPILGLSHEARISDVKQRYQDHQQWEQLLDKDEEKAVYAYTMYDYSFTNAYLRRRGLSLQAKKDSTTVAELTKHAKVRVERLDRALKKAPKGEIKKLYRYHETPAGVSPSEYMARYFEKDGIYHEDGYMSTSGDPEFIMAHLYSRNKGAKNKNYFVMELITSQGASMQKREETRGGDIQSLESEILLPRNMEFIVHDTRKSQQFAFADDRKDLHEQYTVGGSFERFGAFKKGEKLSFPLVQLVDKKLAL